MNDQEKKIPEKLLPLFEELEQECLTGAGIPFMVRYLTTSGISHTYGQPKPFTLRYRRVNGTFYGSIRIGSHI